jgi:serine/threonine protein phosphatase PrpC
VAIRSVNAYQYERGMLDEIARRNIVCKLMVKIFCIVVGTLGFIASFFPLSKQERKIALPVTRFDVSELPKAKPPRRDLIDDDYDVDLDTRAMLERRDGREEIDHDRVAVRFEKQLALAMAQQQSQRDNPHFMVGKTTCSLKKDSSKVYEVESGNLDGFEYGTVAIQGDRPTMEDEYLAISFDFYDQKIQMFGVFDGHGGFQASRFVKTEMQSFFTRELDAQVEKHGMCDLSVYNAFKLSFKRMEDAYPEMDDGTTASVAIIVGETIYVANSGDSRTIIKSEDGVIQLTKDAKPDDAEFGKRVRKRGGSVEFWPPFYRVTAPLSVVGLSCASSIGDKGLIGPEGICCVPARPKVTKYPLPRSGYLIIGCDGLFDVASTDDVGIKAMDYYEEREFSVRKMAEALGCAAVNSKTEDNVSAIVVKL